RKAMPAGSILPSAPASARTSSSGAISTPTGCVRRRSASACARQIARRTTHPGSSGGNCAPSAGSCRRESSACSAPLRINRSGSPAAAVCAESSGMDGLLGLGLGQGRVGVYVGLEGFDANAVDHVDEPLGFAVPQPQIGLDELFDDVGHLVARERRADDAPDGCAPAAPLGQIQAVDRACLAPAEGDLVPLLAGLVHAEDADVANVVMAAGIDAAGNVQVQF